MSPYRKTIAAIVGALLSVAAIAGLHVAPGVSDAVVDVVDAVIGLLTVLGVFHAANKPAPR